LPVVELHVVALQQVPLLTEEHVSGEAHVHSTVVPQLFTAVVLHELPHGLPVGTQAPLLEPPELAPLLDPLEPLLEPCDPELLPLVDPLPLDPPELLPLAAPLDPPEPPLLEPLPELALPLLEALDPAPLLDPLLALAPLLLEPLPLDPLLPDPLVVESSLASSEAIASPRVASKPEPLPPSSAASSLLPSSLAIASSPGALSSPLLDAPEDPEDPEDAWPPLPLLLAVPSPDVPLGPSSVNASTRVASSMPKIVPQPPALPASAESASANARRPLCRRTGRTIHSSTIDKNT
jgi:hypothetical protein